MIAAVKAAELGRAWRLCRIWPTEGRSSLAGRGLAGARARLGLLGEPGQFVGRDFGQARRGGLGAFRALGGKMEIELSSFRRFIGWRGRRSLGL